MTNYNSQYINPISRATMDASMEQLLVPCPPYVWPVVSSGGRHGTVAGPLSTICLTRGQFWRPAWNSCWSPVHHVSDPWSVLGASMEQLLVPCPPYVWPVVSSGGQHGTVAGPLSTICLTRGQFWRPAWNSCWSPVHHMSDPWSVLGANMEQLLVPCPPYVWPVVSSGGQHGTVAGPLSTMCLTRGQFWRPAWNSCWSPVHHVSDPWSVLEASMMSCVIRHGTGHWVTITEAPRRLVLISSDIEQFCTNV